jgi:hypothetical protein
MEPSRPVDRNVRIALTELPRRDQRSSRRLTTELVEPGEDGTIVSEVVFGELGLEGSGSGGGHSEKGRTGLMSSIVRLRLRGDGGVCGVGVYLERKST